MKLKLHFQLVRQGANYQTVRQRFELEGDVEHLRNRLDVGALVLDIEERINGRGDIRVHATLEDD